MTERIVAMLEEMIVDLTDAAEAIREEKIGVAVAKLELVSARLRAAATELRA